MVMIQVKPPLTLGERLTIQRIRRGLTQVQAAYHWAVSAHRYRDWECDRGPGIPVVQVGKLKPYEACRILRQRIQMTQTQVAAALNMSRLWVIRAEAGRTPSVHKLVEFWSNRL